MEPQTLLDVSGAVPESVTSSVLDACHNRGFSGIQEAITNAIASGWGVMTIALRCTLHPFLVAILRFHVHM